MFITSIKIDGVDGEVEIRKTLNGAVLLVNGVEEAETFPRDDEADFAKFVQKAAVAICGRVTKGPWKGQVNATNSMVYEIRTEIERVSGR